MIQKVAETAEKTEKNNISFTSYFLLGELEKCLEILISTDRLPEAAFLLGHTFQVKFPEWCPFGRILWEKQVKKRLKA